MRNTCYITRGFSKFIDEYREAGINKTEFETKAIIEPMHIKTKFEVSRKKNAIKMTIKTIMHCCLAHETKVPRSDENTSVSRTRVNRLARYCSLGYNAGTEIIGSEQR